MKIQDENFIANIMTETRSHDEWLCVVRFGLVTLLDNQRLLTEVLVAEATREADKMPTHTSADEIARIVDELGLRLVVDARRENKGAQPTKD